MKKLMRGGARSGRERKSTFQLMKISFKHQMVITRCAKNGKKWLNDAVGMILLSSSEDRRGSEVATNIPVKLNRYFIEKFLILSEI